MSDGFGVQLCPSVRLCVCRCVTQATRRHDSANDVKVFPVEFGVGQRAGIVMVSLSNMIKRTNFCFSLWSVHTCGFTKGSSHTKAIFFFF